MIILFSPSEDKLQPPTGGLLAPEKFFFKKDLTLLKSYDKFLHNAPADAKAALLSSKKPLLIDIFTSPTTKALSLYTGVAYKALDFASLKPTQQGFLEKNLIIFSNLFGPVFGGEELPFYKLKQGKNLGENIPKLYASLNSAQLDAFLQNHQIIDLRAKFYENYYKIPFPYYEVIFRKNSKVLSHFAKHYRGLLVRALAVHNDLNLALKSLQSKNISKENLKQNITTYVLDF